MTPTEPQQTDRRTAAEWVTLAVSSLLVAGLIALVIYDWAVAERQPPILQATPHASVPVREVYYQPFTVANLGGSVATAVQVVAELQLPGEASEQGEQEVDFLAGGERKQGVFIFNRDPEQGNLTLRVAGYKLPYGNAARQFEGAARRE